MGNQLNMCDIMDTAMDLGIRYGSGETLDYEDKSGFIQALSPSSILGTTETTPIAMAAAFAAFANEGEFCGPKPIIEIKDRNGEKLDLPGEGCKRVLDKEVAKGVAYALTQTFNGGTTSSLKIGVPAGAKTGTTNFEVGHTWLLGFTKTLSTAVWTGDPGGTRDWRTNGAGAVRGHIYGATISGKTWQAYMSQAVKETKGNTGFARPSSKYFSGGGSGGGGGSSTGGGGGGTGGGGGGGSQGNGGTGGGGGGGGGNSGNNGGGGGNGGGNGNNGGGNGGDGGGEAPGLGGN